MASPLAVTIKKGMSAAGTGLGGPLIGGLFSTLGGILGNKSSAKQAQRQMDFQERMSNTAHQREVRDLRAAGLNPILTATGGSGASTPGGAMAQQQDVLSPGVNSAMQALALKQTLKQQAATIENLEADTRKKHAERDTNLRQGDLLKAQAAGAEYDNTQRAVMSGIWSSAAGEAAGWLKTFLGGGGSSAFKTSLDALSRGVGKRR